MYKLIAFDLDGTLLDDRKNIPQENMEAICYAAAKGIVIVPASGRLYRFMPSALLSLPFIKYCISLNGALVYDAAEDKILSTAAIPLETSLRVFDYWDTLDVIYDYYVDDMSFTNRSFFEKADDYFTDPVLNAMLHTYTVKIRTVIEDMRAYAITRGAPLLKLQANFRDSDERLRQLMLMPEMFPELVCSTSLSNNIEVNSPLATKGQGLAFICRLLDISPDEVISFGDGTNDLDMITFSGTGVAMSNAEESVKAAASYITGSNNKAGVASALRHFGVI